MDCEAIRRTVKRILGIFVLLPLCVLLLPMVALTFPFILLLETDSCEEYKEGLQDFFSAYLEVIVDCATGRFE